MSEGTSSSNIAAVPDDVHKSLLIDGSDVQTKVGHVAKFDRDDKRNDLDENIVLDDIVHFKKTKEDNQFIGLTKEVFILSFKLIEILFFFFFFKGIKNIH